MKVFVLGATGYIGGAVVQALVQAGHDVSGLTRSADSAERLRQRGVASHIGTLFDRHVIGVVICPTMVYGVGSGLHTESMRELAEAIAARLGLRNPTVSLSLEDGTRRLGVESCEFALASNSRVRAKFARELGWQPRHDDLIAGIRSGQYPI